MAVSGDGHRRYGGNTTCFEAEIEPRHHLVIDCGTGLRGLQRDVAADPARHYTVLFTHYHWDHIQGLAMFAPLREAGARVRFYGPRFDGRGTREILQAVLRPPWWPVTFDEFAAEITFHDLEDRIQIGPVEVHHAPLAHPQGVVGYRVDGPNRSVVVATDHEAGDPAVDARLISLAAGADVLIHDAQYTPTEYDTLRKGWGHSTWEAAVRVAADAGVRHLVLTSHDPDRTDLEIDSIRGEARSRFPFVDAAYEGMHLPL
jgi:phosphoribosyl 1,2-cyclic phosphodiesterase